jgi:hypothetical protein
VGKKVTAGDCGNRLVRGATQVAAGTADLPCMNISAISLQGLAQAQAQLDAAASNIVQSAAKSSSSTGNVVSPDIASQIVALNAAQTQFQLDASTLKTADQSQGSLLNIFA